MFKFSIYLADMKKTVLFLLLSFFGLTLLAQTVEPPFQKEIDAFAKEDSIHHPVRNSILFVGSSSLRKWEDIQAYFPGYPVINRGFGGSSLPDVIQYADRIIYPYRPKQVIIYCGENDLAASDTVTAKMVLQRFRHLFSMIRSKLGPVPVVFISIKPSPSRWRLEPVIMEANRLIRQFLLKQNKAAFADVHHAMLLADGSVNRELFLSDNLHMNEKGYKIWQYIIGPYLKK
ncbi:MAG: SGNH/GDSL hydrolase family protein [Sediminibacterium sp.]